jgi:hypothetical protein
VTVSVTVDTTAALWLAVVALGAYHGLNPAMGWPLAVANGMSAHRGAAVFTTLLPLGIGHLAAMAVIVLPFALLGSYVEHGRAIRLAAGAALLLFGLYKLVDRRHPRMLARIAPTRLAWWSFVMATAHGAGLMLAPVALGLCVATPDASPGRSDITTALAVTLVHTLAMLVSGVAIAWAVYRWLGLAFIRRAWFNLDLLWGTSLVLAGAAASAMAAWAPMPLGSGPRRRVSRSAAPPSRCGVARPRS